MATDRRRRSAAAAVAADGCFAWPGARAAWPDPRAWLAAQIANEVEHRRLFPWIAVAYGVGIALAFAADGPLAILPPLLAGGAAVAAAIASRSRPLLLGGLIAGAAIAFGFAAAVVRMSAGEAPILSRTAIGLLEGFVESVEERPAGGRLVIAVAKLDRVGDAERPARVRVSARALDGVKPGDYITATARLMPPPEAARPGGYDFARDAYFRGIGAVGSVSGKFRILDPPPRPPGTALAVAAAVDRARNAMTARIAGAIAGSPARSRPHSSPVSGY